MSVQKAKVYDDDIRFVGTKAYSYKVEGQCLDGSGAPVAGATVELWQTSPMWPGQDEPRLVATGVADAQGKYGFAVPNTTNTYYVLAYVTGRGGVTVRSLTGAA